MEPVRGGPTPLSYGVGARVSLHPMSDRYVDIILGALADAEAVRGDLTTSTGVVSTFVGGDEQQLLAYLTTLIVSAVRRSEGEHLTASLLLSRGCPGEVTCDLRTGPWASHEDLVWEETGVETLAEWSLYPLVDAGATASDHMGPIMAAIDEAKRTGLYAGSDHYVTRLHGDAAAVIGLVTTAWRETGRSVQHVTSHLSLSFNSPTEASTS
ncbi:MAG TPA: YkoF family thiamine/hydroxymethylpyrimidine-binding protein [Propionibacteriaceae bacterium]|nr:YkoF family thiamine/hydroxymethylpyrimidine-binding protein [Propionibacteriaceae bacterium]